MAAVALVAGHSDPLAVLATHPDDLPYLHAVIAEAMEIRHEQRLAGANYVSDRTSSLTVSGFSKVMRRAVKALRR